MRRDWNHDPERGLWLPDQRVNRYAPRAPKWGGGLGPRRGAGASSAPTYADSVAGHDYGASGTTVSQAFTGASVGDIIFFTASNSSSRALTGCTDTLGNTYSAIGTTTGGGTYWSKVTTGGNGTITGTFAGSITLATWLYVRVSGSTAGSPIDAYAMADATGTYGIPFNMTSSATGLVMWLGPDAIDTILYSSGVNITAAPFTAQIANQLYWAAAQAAGSKNMAINMYNSGTLQIGTYVAVK